MQGKLQAKNENDVVLREMSDGDFFGERALLTHEARSASVVAVEHCDLFILEKVHFDDALVNYPSFSYHIRAIAEQRSSVAAAPTRRASDPVHAALGKDVHKGASVFSCYNDQEPGQAPAQSREPVQRRASVHHRVSVRSAKLARGVSQDSAGDLDSDLAAQHLQALLPFDHALKKKGNNEEQKEETR